MTFQSRVRTARISVVLPGTWANIPLDNEAESDAAISTLIKRQVGRDDRLARLRRDARERLRALARDAREANAVQLALSLEILPGVPFPASLVADYRDLPAQDADSTPTVKQVLLQALPGGEILELESGIAARTFRATTMRPGTEAIPDIKLEYFLFVPNGEQLLHIVADVPTECDPKLIVTLFDAIVDSIRWYEDDDLAVSQD